MEVAGLTHNVGFRFIDVEACHGYLLHEFLSARSRPGRFGGDFAGRTRLLATIIDRIRERYPDLMILVRLSVFDTLPYKTSREVGQPMEYRHLLPYSLGFGVNPDNPFAFDLDEPLQLLRLLKSLGVGAVNLSCGSPYYNPHIQRPAAFPPSDGYQPPEDPLIGAVRQIQAARQCKAAMPDLPLIGTGYSYFQDFLPHSRRPSFGPAGLMAWGWAEWCYRIRNFRPIAWVWGRCNANVSVAHSATAQPLRVTALFPAAFRLTPIIRHCRKRKP